MTQEITTPDDGDWYRLPSGEYVPCAESELMNAPAGDPGHGYEGGGFAVYTNYEGEYFDGWDMPHPSDRHHDAAEGVYDYAFWFNGNTNDVDRVSDVEVGDE